MTAAQPDDVPTLRELRVRYESDPEFHAIAYQMRAVSGLVGPRASIDQMLHPAWVAIQVGRCTQGECEHCDARRAFPDMCPDCGHPRGSHFAYDGPIQCSAWHRDVEGGARCPCFTSKRVRR